MISELYRTYNNMFEIEVGSDYPRGGSNSRTVFRFYNRGALANVSVNGDPPVGNIGGDTTDGLDSLELVLAGDLEHDDFLEALDFAVATLKERNRSK